MATPSIYAYEKLVGLLDDAIDDAIRQDADMGGGDYQTDYGIFDTPDFYNSNIKETPKRHRTILIKTWIKERNRIAQVVGIDERDREL